MFKDTDVIYTYSRKQAIEDGVLVDISNSELTKKFFILPVLLEYSHCILENSLFTSVLKRSLI